MPEADVLKDKDYWLPDFCSLPVIGAMLLVAEIVILVVLIAPDEDAFPRGERLLAGSFLAQLIALTCAVCLCQLRTAMLRAPRWLGVTVAYAAVVTIAVSVSALVYWLDHTLAAGLTHPGQSLRHFAFANGLIVALVAAAAFRYFYIRAQWQRQVGAQALAQLQALQARIRPHFLFNSMNTIATLIRSRPSDAEAAVEDLSDLFRAALSAADSLTALRTEIELVRRYLAIEKLRLGDRLSLDWQGDEPPETLEVPAFLLQPLFENAIHHGIQPLAQGGTITVRIAVDPRQVAIEIGNPCPVDAPRHPGGNRMALENIRLRIAHHYGERGKLEVDAVAGYYSCRVTIPQP